MLEELIEENYVSKDDRIAVGVSGGADSMLLLWSLIFKQKKVGFYLKVININHHIRGEESDRDSNFVKDFCEKKKIDCEIVGIDVLKNKELSKKTIEQEARDLRYKAFFDIMKRDGLNKLFLAHHKNDQAETILMHILRGSGIAGACGIKKESGMIFRPLLDLTKQEILNYSKEYGITFVEDSTNKDNTMTRNYVRNVIIPDIEEIYPNGIQAICEFGNKCAEIQSYIESLVDLNYLEFTKNACLIRGEVFSFQNFLVKEYAKKAFNYLGIMADIEAKHYDMLFQLNSKSVNSYFDLPHGLQAKKSYSGIKILKREKKSKKSVEYEFALGEIKIEGYGSIFAEFVRGEQVVYGDGSFYVDFEKISTSAVWRFRKIGDLFSKLGTGSKKLNDYFTDKKIEVEKRDLIPVLAKGNQILVVAGEDISENVKISDGTDNIVKLTFKPLSS